MSTELTPHIFVDAFRLPKISSPRAFICLSPQFRRVSQKHFTNDAHYVFAGFGAPSAVAQAELLWARGVREFTFYGSAGALRPEVQIGDVGFIADALSQEGTSRHYDPNPLDQFTACPPEARARACELQIRAFRSCTTDGLFRETSEKIAEFSGAGCEVIEMEASALYTWARFRGVSAIIFVVVQDAWDKHAGWKVEQNQTKLMHYLEPLLASWRGVSI